MRHPDEGTIHAWLDGALSPDDGHALDQHVATCAECAARVAEARGMIAGASRILASLDSAPVGVVPVRAGARPAGRRGSWWRRPGIGIAAAMAIVAVGTTWTVTRHWAAAPALRSEAAAPLYLAADSVASDAAPAAAPVEPSAPVVQSPAEAPTAERFERVSSAPEASPGADAESTGVAARVTGATAGANAAPAPDSVGTMMLRAREELGVTRVTRQAQAESAMKVEVAAQPRVASLADAPAPPAPASAENRRGAAAAMAPVVSSRMFAETARDLAGCYALEVDQTRAGAAPELPNVVRLAETGDEAAPPGTQSLRAFRIPSQPLVVPPAADTGQLGWRLAMDDSVAIRLPVNGRTVMVRFPTASRALRFGVATSPELPGVAEWRAEVTVQRVPCPSR
ncbi:MAG TPA: zf-HC2 domain-containing protein [Gemmatimonadaceae bacterium]|nr:zf-HC2 domain-containing protein [Gemmatimonadaceae bacterium]